jgi:hypothetical protein
MRGCADEDGCADLRMRGCADEDGSADMRMRGCADEEGCADMQLPENTDTESLCTNSLPLEGSVTKISIEGGLTGYLPPPPTPINDIQMATPSAHPKPAWDQKISTIDKLLSPELLDHILRTTTREKASAQIPFPPGSLAHTSAKQP